MSNLAKKSKDIQLTQEEEDFSLQSPKANLTAAETIELEVKASADLEAGRIIVEETPQVGYEAGKDLASGVTERWAEKFTQGVTHGLREGEARKAQIFREQCERIRASFPTVPPVS